MPYTGNPEDNPDPLEQAASTGNRYQPQTGTFVDQADMGQRYNQLAAQLWQVAGGDKATFERLMAERGIGLDHFDLHYGGGTPTVTVRNKLGVGLGLLAGGGLGLSLGALAAGEVAGGAAGSGTIAGSGAPVTAAAATPAAAGGGSWLGLLTSAPVVTSGIGAAADLYGAHQQAGAEDRATAAQTAANTAALDDQKARYADLTARVAPWVQGGQSAQQQLQGLGAFGEAPPEFTAPTGVTEANDPGYAQRLQEGNLALNRGAAAKGTLLSGGTLKALAKYNQDYASNEFGNVYARAQTAFGNANTAYQNRYGQYLDQLKRLQDASSQGLGAAQVGATL